MSAIPAARHDAYRLTPEDERKINEAIAQALRRWDRPAGYEALPSLERVAHHAIGCTAHDLRDVELRFIHERCAAALLLTPTTPERT